MPWISGCDVGSLSDLINWDFLDNLIATDAEMILPDGTPAPDSSFVADNMDEVQEILWNELNQENFQLGTIMPNISIRRLSDDRGIRYGLLLRQVGKDRFVLLKRVTSPSSGTLVTFQSVELPPSPWFDPGRATLMVVASRATADGHRKVIGHTERKISLYN